MPLAFKHLSENRFYPLVSGHFIGRGKDCEIRLQDPNASSIHAKVIENDSGHLFIQDQGSANGLIVNKKPIKESLLFPGLKIRIGQSSLEVVEISTDEWEALSPESQVLSSQLYQILKKIKITDTGMGNNVEILQKPFQIKCVSGLHLDEVWPIYFAPYTFGKLPLEGQLMGLKLPDVIFRLEPSTSGLALINPEVMNALSLNGGAPLKEAALIRAGDLIHFYQNERIIYSFGVLDL